ncbi:MAG TPA: hypothetical protein PLV56_00770 [Synergistales bacterium]|nr:hypothetical protein [Synergistales bacterium]
MFLKKIFGKEKKRNRPITATEIVKRGMKMDFYREWSRAKQLRVFNPPFWGIHDIFIHQDNSVRIICLKADKSSFVFYGEFEGAHSWKRYDHGLKVIEEDFLEPGNLSWVIYDDYVLYRGSLLPPTEEPYYWGKIIEILPFNSSFDDTWVEKTLISLRQNYSEGLTD